MIIDIHCHYTLSRQATRVAERFSFEPASGDGAAPRARALRPTDFDSCVSDRAVQRWNWRLARWFLRLPPPGPALDQRLAEDFARHLGVARDESGLKAQGNVSGDSRRPWGAEIFGNLRRPRGADATVAGGTLTSPAPATPKALPIERFVMLAFDAVHDDDGQCPPLPRSGDRFGSDIYTSNSFIREMCRRNPTRFLFGASVHPYRRDAVACVEEVFQAGACLLKWIPLHHNIDFTDPRTQAVMRRCAELSLPILIHCGEEFTLTTQCPAHRSIRPLLEVLRQLRREDHMPTVIVAHAATSVTPWGGDGSHGILLAAMTGEFSSAPLLADISSLVTWPKAPYLRRLADRQDLHHKLLFGSDFPVPPSVLRLKRRLGNTYEAIAAMPSWPQRAALASRAAGFNEIVFHRAVELLPHVDFFARQTTVEPA